MEQSKLIIVKDWMFTKKRDPAFIKEMLHGCSVRISEMQTEDLKWLNNFFIWNIDL